MPASSRSTASAIRTTDTASSIATSAFRAAPPTPRPTRSPTAFSARSYGCARPRPAGHGRVVVIRAVADAPESPGTGRAWHMGLLARSVRRGAVALSLLGMWLPATAPAHSAAASSQARKLTIYGHRGASGYRPEHTI